MGLYQTFTICLFGPIVGNVSIFVSGNALIPSSDLDQLGFILKNAVVANLFVLLFLFVSLCVAKSFQKSMKSIQPNGMIPIIACTICGSVQGHPFIPYIAAITALAENGCSFYKRSTTTNKKVYNVI
jgi:hypothetical protein